MNKPPLVRDYRVIVKGLIEKTRKVSFKCPHCAAQLLATEEEVGEPDICPHCGKPFQVTREAKAVLRSRRERAEQSANATLPVPSEIAEEAEQAAREREIAAQELQRQQAEQAERDEQLALQEQAEQRRLEAARVERHQAHLRDETAREAARLEKQLYRNFGIRQYSTLQAIGPFCYSVMLLNIILSVLAIIILFEVDIDAKYKLIGFLALVVNGGLGSVMLLILAESVQLAVNVAQDTERILRAKEAEDGRPWAKQ